MAKDKTPTKEILALNDDIRRWLAIAGCFDDFGARYEQQSIPAVMVNCAATALEGSPPKLATSFGKRC
jgi:hypothetical protein